MSRLHKLLLFTVLIQAAFASCDVFDAESETAINPDQAFISESAAETAVIGIYDQLQSDDYYGAYYQYTADNYVDVGDFQGFFQGFLAPDMGAIPARNDNIFQVWEGAYRVVNAANEVIDKVPPLDLIGFTDEEKNNLVAQARGLRGLAYLDLLTHYAEHYDNGSTFGLAIVAAANNGDLTQLLNPTRSNVADSYAFIEADLQFAIDNLDDSGDNSRMNRAAAQALLARAQLHRGDFEDARDLAAAVIDNANFELVDDITTIYRTEGSAESIFELPFTTLDPSELAVYTITRDEVRPEPSLIESFTEGDARRSMIDFVDGFNGERFVKAEDFASQANPAYIFRMAEAYLIRAEAHFRLGATEDALADLNAVRTRAGLEAHENADDFVDKLLDEYLWEFFAEGHRFRTLVRLGRLADFTNVDEDFRRIYPIPQREIDIDGTNLVQNPGYN